MTDDVSLLITQLQMVAEYFEVTGVRYAARVVREAIKLLQERQWKS